MKFIRYILFFSVYFNILLFSEKNNSFVFREITQIDNDNINLINTDFKKLNYENYLYYFSVVSIDKNNLNIYLNAFKTLEKDIDGDLRKNFNTLKASDFKSDKQKEFSEKLLLYLHERLFKKYNLYADKISDIFNKGEYNCVSSSIIYGIFLTKYGLKYTAVETPDHVFIKIFFENTSVDVETTTKYGFDPGKKKEVLDDFGKMTGFSYVPEKDYKLRSDIDFKKLLLLVYHNIANQYQIKNDYLTSLKLAYVIFKGRNDERGNEDFYIYFYNYIVHLVNNRSYKDSINLTNAYLENIAWSNNLVNLRFDILFNYITSWNEFLLFNETKTFLKNENERFKALQDDNKFIRIYFLFYLKMIENKIQINDFTESYRLLKEFKDSYIFSETDTFFESILYRQIKFLQQNNFSENIDRELNVLKINFPGYSEVILRHEVNFHADKINNMLINKNYFNALNEAKMIFLKYENQNLLKNLLLNSYISYTIFLYNTKDMENIIKYCEEALMIFPSDKTILNNYASFFKNYITDEIKNKNYFMARKTLNTAKEKFPNDSYLKELDTYLSAINY